MSTAKVEDILDAIRHCESQVVNSGNDIGTETYNLAKDVIAYFEQQGKTIDDSTIVSAVEEHLKEKYAPKLEVPWYRLKARTKKKLWGVLTICGFLAIFACIAVGVSSCIESVWKDQERIRLEEMRIRTEEAKAFQALKERFYKSGAILKINTERNTKTGITRVNGDGKFRYLVVRAFDNNGKPLTCDLTDWETGEKFNASVFSIQVSEETFERFKKDQNLRASDAPALGSKPENSSSFNIPISIQNRTIKAIR